MESMRGSAWSHRWWHTQTEATPANLVTTAEPVATLKIRFLLSVFLGVEPATTAFLAPRHERLLSTHFADLIWGNLVFSFSLLLLSVPCQALVQFRNERREGGPKSEADCPQFDDVETDFAPLDLGDLALRFTDFFGKLYLRDPRRLPNFPQQREQGGVLSRVDCLVHARACDQVRGMVKSGNE